MSTSVLLFTLLFFRAKDLIAAGIVRNRMTLSRWMKRADDPFPQPIALGANTRVWRADQVQEWLSRRETWKRAAKDSPRRTA